jgi:hypothetical protein
MAAYAATSAFTMMELANRLDPEGNFARIAEVLSQKNQWIETAKWVEANGNTTHTYPKRLSEPAGMWTAINEGVQYSASDTVPVTEDMGMLEDYSRVDDRIIKMSKKASREMIRASEDIAFLAGMSKTATSSFFYANRATEPKKPMGLWNRPDYDAIADANVHNSGGTGGGSVYTSIAVVEWGDDGCGLIYPRNSKTMGIMNEDLGRQLVHDGSGNPYLAWVSHFWYNFGIMVRDPRAVQRICNVIAAASGTGAFDEDDLIAAINNLEGEGMNAYIYMNKNIRKNMLILAKDKTNVQYTPDDPFGRKFLTQFMGVMVKIVEQLVQTEAEVS